MSNGSLKIAMVLVLLAGSVSAESNQANGQEGVVNGLAQLPQITEEAAKPVDVDWLVAPIDRVSKVFRGAGDREITMTNGLIRRVWRVQPNAATVAFDNLMTGASLLRGVKPEARIELDGQSFDIGGLLGQQEYGYLRPEWLEAMIADPDAFRLCSLETGKTEARFAWKRKRYSSDLPWPPPGVSLTLRFESARDDLKGLHVATHYEMYDGIPLLCKWLTIHNKTHRTIRLNKFISEILAVVEYESQVEVPGQWEHPNIHVENDYAFFARPRATYWVPDPQYESQVNYARKTPNMLECQPPIGPDAMIEPDGVFETFRTFELVHDSTERERKGLAVRRMYRTIAPWVTENPILMHVRYADPESVCRAVDQCAEVGFEMVIMTFGSGFNAENTDPSYIAQVREMADYAHSKGIELGGYSLLASRRISDEHDVINPKTGKPGGATFGNSPCIGSVWGQEYFRKLTDFFDQTGLDILEHDGSYPGDVCASVKHPGHRGLEDSQWTQWKTITDFYKWCRGRGIYLNVPDWYFLRGSNKTGMGYRETNWSLTRDRQIILGRQNIYDGTWQKIPSMGWMFVPLVQYHGGGAAATLEPLAEHLDAYGAHLAQNFGSGVQACYRGPRLYDSDETKALVKKWVDFYKTYRRILDADVIHVRRADGRDLDCLLHVDPQGPIKGLAMVYNPLDQQIAKTIRLPLYYTGLSDRAHIREQQGPASEYELDREYNVCVPVSLGPRGVTWLIIEE